MRASFALIVAALALATATQSHAQQKRIYVAADDHTDIIWSAPESYYYPYFSHSLDFYLAQIKATAADPSDQQMRWNADGTLWLWAYAQRHTQAQFDTLMGKVADGHIGVPMNTIVSVHGATPVEGVLRDYLYAGRLERKYNIRFELGIAQENQVSSYGLGAVLSGSGAKYFWKGTCSCGTPPMPGKRQYDAYWWVGADGSRILSKWETLEAKLPSAQDGNGNQGPGGYAEAFVPREVIPFVSTNASFRSHLPYEVIGMFGQGWDNINWTKDLSDPTFSVPFAARDLTDASRRIIVSNETDFFHDFEAAYGPNLPKQSVSFGNDWKISTAAYAAKSARVKRAIEKLRGAEAMATLVSLGQPGFMDSRVTARDTADRSIALYFEHNVGGGGNAKAGERERYQEAKAQAVETYVNKLQSDATAALSGMIPSVGGATRVFAFNPLGWTRTDVAQAAAPGTGPVNIVDVTTGKQVAAELIGSGAARVVRFLAAGVPSVGYKVFEIRAGLGSASFPTAATYSAGTLISAAYALHMNAGGALDSVIDKASGRQLANPTSTLQLNDFGSGTGRVTLERAGPVSAKVRADIGGTLPRTVRVTLYAGVDRIEIEDVLRANFSDQQTFSFAFATPNSLVRHEELGAVIRAQLEPKGQYSKRDFNSNYEWLTLNHFAAETNGDTGPGVVLSNADAYFMKLGNSAQNFLDQTSPRIDVLAGRSIPTIPGQAGDRSFLYRFALKPIAAYDQASAMRMSLEHQNPLVTGLVTGVASAKLPAAIYSLVTVSDPNQLVWSVKPAEDGIARGVIVRVWNQSATPTSFAATIGAPYAATAAMRTTHIETDLADQSAATSVAGNQIATFRLGTR